MVPNSFVYMHGSRIHLGRLVGHSFVDTIVQDLILKQNAVFHCLLNDLYQCFDVAGNPLMMPRKQTAV